MRTALGAGLIAGALALGMGAAPVAAEVTLNFATTNAPNIHLNVRVLHPWAKRLNEEGKGILKIEVRDGPAIANHLNYYDRTLNDVIQIAWGLHSGPAGKFPRVEVASLPYLADRSEVASVALYRLYRSGLLDAEYNEAKPLMFVGFPTGQFHMRVAPKSPTDFSGLKIIAGSKIQTDIVSSLGAAPVSLIITENYQALQRGVADGTTLPWTAFPPFKIAEVANYHIEASIGGGTGHVIMAKRKYDSLPEAARKLIDKYSSEQESRTFGTFWDVVQREGRKLAEKPGHTIVELNPEQTAELKRKLAHIEAEWVSRTPNGAAVLARYKTILAELRPNK